MPNHISNEIIFEGKKKLIKKIISQMKSININFQIINKNTDKIQLKINIIKKHFDLNKIIKRPGQLNIESGSNGDYGLYILTGNSKGIEFLGQMEIMNRWKKFDMKHKKECLKLGKKYLKNIKKFGYKDWYDWSCENWGTKWNTYNEKRNNNKIMFETAWSGITKLIQLLSLKHPNVKIKYRYSSEDAGYNIGDYIIENGIIEDNSPRENSNEAYELYLNLHPDCDYIKKIDGKYQYIDE